MKYQPIYMPATYGEPPIAPIFDTEDEANNWIEERSRKCWVNNNGEICHSCCAEWMVDEII
jgi:antibiotic biosynthesis monooxygenase (ABM) superfamily enzyme